MCRTRKASIISALALLFMACGSSSEGPAGDGGTTTEDGAKLSWIRGIESGELVEVTGADSDPFGNFYVTGTFTGDFPLGETSATHSEEPNIFIASYSVHGERRWLRTLASERAARGGDITVDEAGQIFVTGSFAGVASFDELHSIESAGEGDIMLASLEKDGAVRWLKAFGGLGNEVPQSITARRGRVCVAGYMRGSFEIGGMRAQGLMQLDGFASCWRTSDAAPFWLRGFAGDKNDIATAIALADNGDTWIAMSFENNLSALGMQLQTEGGFDAVLLRVDSNGSPLWHAQVGSTENDQIQALAVDGSDALYMAARLGGPLTQEPQLAEGRTGSVVAHLDASGQPVWATKIDHGGTLTDLSVQGNQIEVAGGLNDERTLAEHTLVSEGGSDAFYATLSSDGQLLDAQSFGSLSNDLIVALAADRRGGVFVTGQHGQAITFEDQTVSSLGLNGAFVARIAQRTEAQ